MFSNCDDGKGNVYSFEILQHIWAGQHVISECKLSPLLDRRIYQRSAHT